MTSNQTVARRMSLGGVLLPSGSHLASWRHPNVPIHGGFDFAHYAEVARMLEQGGFDSLFVGDVLGIFDRGREALAADANASVFEPLTLLAALSVVTERIGLIATVSTSYNEPFHVARKFASLDHLSGGRAGWNIVTSPGREEAGNFGREVPVDHSMRYQRAAEFVDVVKALWDSWDDDAFVRDKQAGVFFDPDKIRPIRHRGTHFSVDGPLNVARPLQGHPLLVQAGSSVDGITLAARVADLVYTAHQNLEDAQEYYAAVKEVAAGFGRDPAQVRVMPGAFVCVAETQGEAEDKFAYLQDLVDPGLGLSLLSGIIGNVDLSIYPIDGPLPELPETLGAKGRQALVTKLARREGLNIREIYKRVLGARGHRTIVGAPSQVADELEEWWLGNAADGFNIMFPYLPGGAHDFIRLVVPELRRRGHALDGGIGDTFRDRLGLPRPKAR